MRRLEGRSALVTGATRGSGRAVAWGFARDDPRVLVNGQRAADCAAVAVMFLASDEAAFVTGTVLAADGGWSAYGSV